MDKEQLAVLIGKNICRYREESRLTQRDLAEKVGVGTAFISRIERGEKSMKLYTLYILADALGVTCDALLYPESASVHISTIKQLLNGKPDLYLKGVEALIRTCGDYFLTEDDGNLPTEQTKD